MDRTDAWLILSGSGLTARRQRALLEVWPDPLEILGASADQLKEVEGITAVHVDKLHTTARELDVADWRQQLLYLGVRLVPITDEGYPPLLRETPDPPPLLYVQGELTRRDEMGVALVGTRKCTPYGRTVARRLASDLARRGFTIISGLAEGIDGEAHEGALEAEGRTVAVMASGPDITYPGSHKKLRGEIAASGAVITEYAPGMQPLRERFPSRNRIIAGLALGTLVIEAPSRSGALITARLSAEFGRETLAVPGSVDSPTSHGCHELIKEGCRLVEVAEDVVEGLGIMLQAVPAERPPQPAQVSGDEQAVLEALNHQPQHVDEVASASGLAVGQLNATLMMLEMKGLVRRFPGNTYVRL
jgi:DNA processing protein